MVQGELLWLLSNEKGPWWWYAAGARGGRQEGTASMVMA